MNKKSSQKKSLKQSSKESLHRSSEESVNYSAKGSIKHSTKNSLKQTNMAAQMNRNHKMVRLILVLLLIIVIGVFSTIMLYYNYYMYDVQYLNTSVKIVQGITGFNTDRDALKFGKIAPGGGGVKYFTITASKDVLIRITVTGDMQYFLTFMENNFVLKAGESKTITSVLNVPEDTKLGEYSGKIRVNMYRPSLI
jgi:hypothetical protein